MRAAARKAQAPRSKARVSTAFGCTMQGEVPEDDVVRIAAALAEFCDGVALADTVGYANPAQIRRVFRRVKKEIGDKLEGAHLHNTRGLGLANALAAYEEGVRHFDSSMGGLGGCPFAPGASGNVITEDLVFMFESMGVATGIDLDKLHGSAQADGARRCPTSRSTATWRSPACPKDSVLPLEGVRVVEFAHMVMGPTCGLVLADLGAEVIKVEPLEGDNTRRLQAAGAGFFPVFNRNKKSLAVDLKQRRRAWRSSLKLIDSADVADGELPSRRAGQAGFRLRGAVASAIPRLVYCSLKGFLNGPYEHRPALDEVVQMMGGLAYMTGLPDRPLRAGSSVIDIMGGTFAAVGILAALREREKTGTRQARDQRAVREHGVPGRAAHGAVRAHRRGAAADVGEAPAWGVYDIFDTSGRRPPVRRRGHRHAVGSVLPRVRRCRARGRSAAEDQRRPRQGARLAAAAAGRGDPQALHARPSWRQSSRRSACPTRRSPSPGTCSTTRTSTPAACSRRRIRAARTFKVPSLPLELDGERLA